MYKKQSGKILFTILFLLVLKVSTVSRTRTASPWFTCDLVTHGRL